ncbi:MAG: O-antigen ligase family protein [Beijerinckiaceae bacterium]|nr:O-antigen ligase family protein [Beijerinckiaceae bacterium]
MFYVCTPFAAALLLRRTVVSGAPLWLFGACVIVMFILGLALSGSRTALLLGMASLAASAAWIARDTLTSLMRQRGALWAIAIAAVLVLPAAMGMGLLAILGRFDPDGLADTRWPIYEHALAVTKAYWPFGAGLGSFVRAFQWDEPTQMLSAQFVNQAHNDWLQIVMETGVLGLAAAGIFIVWCTRAFMKKAEGDESAQRLRKAALLAILLLATHSLWDYPLRTIALSALLGLACALTCAPAPEQPGARSKRRSRRRER